MSDKKLNAIKEIATPVKTTTSTTKPKPVVVPVVNRIEQFISIAEINAVIKIAIKIG